MRTLLSLLIAAAVLLPGAASLGATPSAPLGSIRALPTPAAPGSGEPCLAVSPEGAVFMSWFEKLEKGHALKVARLEGSRWSKPSTVAAGDSFFVNWADFPSLVVVGKSHLAIAWPWKHGGGTYAYDVRIAQSKDGGRTWGAPTIPHRDDTPTEHGFISLVPARGGVRAIWLDGRKYMEKATAAKPNAKGGHDEEHGGEMTLRSAWLGPDGTLAEEAELDGRACDCCQTGAAVTANGVLVAYRDRDDQEIRDISAVRLENGVWTEPAPVAVDGWKSPGCPVNGPAVDAIGQKVVAAWFALVGDVARVQASFSNDGGRTFGVPVPIPSADPLGRTDVLMLEDGSALVMWLDADGTQARIQAARVTGREAGETMTVARTSAARASGFPRMVKSGKRVIFAWTEAGTRRQVRVAAADLR